MEKFDFGGSATPATSATSATSDIKSSKSSKSSDGAERLSRAADHYGCDHDELLSWYQEDLPMIATMPSKDLAWAIQDYLKGRNIYSRKATGEEA